MSEKIKEPISLRIKKKWVNSKPTTILLILILITSFVALNLWIQSIDLAQIDVTENKVYSLTDASKKEIANVNKDVKIYVYGYVEESSLVDLIKQYCRENGKITFEILTEESNKGKVEEYALADNYPVVIVESEGTSTMIDAQTEFNTYDYATGQEVDLTEQTLTNTILNLTIKDKPKVYMLTGHGEYTENQMSILTTYLKNEAYEYKSINLLNESVIPKDCNVLLMMSPTSDLLENEIAMILEYINNGGNIIYTKDTEENGKIYPNYQKILDVYGLSVENGFVYETDAASIVSGYPHILMPQIAPYSEITSEIYSDGYLLFEYAQKVIMADEEKANDLNVEYEKLLSSSEESYYVTDVYSDITNVASTSNKESSDLAVIATKTINPEKEESEQKKSKIIVVGNGIFITDAIIDVVSQSYPISYIGNNKDFMMNSIAFLTDRTDTLKIRKEMNTSTYAPNAQQDTIVRLIIFGVPALIILAGIVVWNRRKKKR